MIREKVNYPFSKENLIKKIYQNVSLIENESTYLTPGIQTNILLKCKEIDYILNYGVEKCKELFYKDSNIEDVTYAIYPWIFISRNETTQSHYHHHNLFAPNVYKSIKNNYTFTYYVQMPNNLKDNDGKLFYINEEERTQTAFLPEENELVIFPANVLHRPETAINSTLDRIVIAANVLFDIPTLKEKKTLM
jgi:hypothetical protein